MTETVEDNKVNKIIRDSYNVQDGKFKHNFIDVPWDDRTKESKVCIIALLITIFVAIMACVIQNFVTHYRGFDYNKKIKSSDINCPLVKMEDYRYVAKITSVATEQLLCLGAVLSVSSVLTNEICVKSGPIRLRVGSNTDPRCKKGFSVEIVQVIFKSITYNKLVLLYTFINMGDCVDVIGIKQQFEWGTQAYIIGRPTTYSIRSLTRQPVKFAGKGNCTQRGINVKTTKGTICVKNVGRCPVRIGDLLVQNGYLYGVASVSIKSRDKNQLAYFSVLDFLLKDSALYLM